jgi:phosphoenolpyruvate carboxykinase (GTP)
MVDVADVNWALDAAGLTNQHVRDYVRHGAEVTGVDCVEVVSAADDQRLIAESLETGAPLRNTRRRATH